MPRYEVQHTTRDGEATLRLRDGASGALAEVWPGCGLNAFQLDLPAPEGATGSSGAGGPAGRKAVSGETVTVVQAPPDLSEIRRRPSWWGVPLLFPFPGAIPDGEYAFGGRRLRLGRPEQPVVPEGKEAPGARRNYHGFVMDAPWTVERAAGDDSGATVHATFDAATVPELLEGFPFPFRVAATYTLDHSALRLRFRAENPGPGDLPCAFGAHPFFRLPLGPAGSPEACLVRIPGARRWDGRRLRELLAAAGAAPVSRDEFCPPVSPELDLRTPRPFVAGVFNGLYTDLARENGWIEASVLDPVNRREAVMRASSGFENLVFWSPPGRPELCLEPWSAPSNVFNLAARGVPHHGLTVLAPGESATWEVTLSLRSLPG